MGMYTEFIFGCELEDNTPEEVINILKYLCGKVNDEPVITDELRHPFFDCERWRYIFSCSSYYFGVNRAFSEIWYDDISEAWHISTRSNLKNYGSEIEQFCDWIKPFVASGSGWKDVYGISIYEDSDHTYIYSKCRDVKRV